MAYSIQEIQVGNLSVYVNNSRTHSTEQVKQLSNSINEFGFTNPLLIDKNKETLVFPHWEWVGCRCSEGVICMNEQDFILFTQFMIAAETVLLKHNVQIKYLNPLSQ